MYFVRSTLVLNHVNHQPLLNLSHCESALVHYFYNVLGTTLFRIQGSLSDDDTDLGGFFNLVQLH
jgi:hypothetical protein